MVFVTGTKAKPQLSGFTPIRIRRDNKGAMQSIMQFPPPVIAGLYVVEFAHVDDSVRFEQRNTLGVNGIWLGRVPNLAICQDFETREFMVQHCNEKWEPLGIAAGFKTIEDAKHRTECSYHGISGKWVCNSTSEKEAHALYLSGLKAESCSFCGRAPLEVTAIVGDKVRICNHCIDKFYEEIHLLNETET